MRVPVVQVRVMDMRVPHPAMAMRMGMGFGHGPVMDMVVMAVVMPVAVFMLHHFMQVTMLVTLGQVQP
jgi:hypothetical protein